MDRIFGEKSLRVGASGSQHCETMTKSISPLLVRRPQPEKWGLCEGEVSLMRIELTLSFL
jgi:hypothetical protein